MKTKLLYALLLAPSLALAQSNALETYVEMGLKSNLTLKQENIRYDQAILNLNSAKGLFQPQITALANYTLADGGRKINIPVGDLLNPVYTTLNQLTGTSAFPQISNVNEQFLPNDFHETKVRIIQPLFNSDIYFNYKAQKELVSVQLAHKKAYENELRFEITSAYLNLIQATEAVAVLEETRTLTNELVATNQKFFSNGKITADVISGSEYERDNIVARLTTARKQLELSKAYFNFLLNRDLNEEIIIDKTFTIQSLSTLPLDSLKGLAITQRQELKQLEGANKAQAIGMQQARNNAYLPNVNVVGDVGYQGFQYKFNQDQRFWLVQFSLSWDLFRGGEKQRKIQQAKLNYDATTTQTEQTRRQIELQVIQSYQDRLAAQQVLESTRSGIANAERAFRIIQSKYREGQVLQIEYLDAQNRLTTSKLNSTLAYYDLLRTDAALYKTVSML